jgi:glycosyltransferase involved in cell wall biosynthesis
MKRLLTVGHSYVVAANRRLAHEVAVQGRGRWEVTAVAPTSLPGDLRTIDLEPIDGEACSVKAMTMRLARFPHLRRYERAVRSIVSQPWDVVHIWEEPFVAAAAQVASAAPSSARVVPATFQNIAKRYPPPLSLFEHRVMRRADAWIAFGETVHATAVAKALYAQRPSRVIPPGVDVCRFKPDSGRRDAIRQRFGWPSTTDEAPVVGFLGRFVPEKGLATLMRALEATTAPWRALFVGGGPMLADLEAFASAHRDRVRVVTNVRHGEVPAHLNAMDVLCAPSETTPRWREQFGRMLIEGMASGVPLIASRSGEIPFVVGDAGVLVDERQVPAWTNAIETLLASTALRHNLAARGLVRARERFAWPVVARAHLELFDSLL